MSHPPLEPLDYATPKALTKSDLPEKPASTLEMIGCAPATICVVAVAFTSLIGMAWLIAGWIAG